MERDNNTHFLRVDGVKQPVAVYNLDVIISVPKKRMWWWRWWWIWLTSGMNKGDSLSCGILRDWALAVDWWCRRRFDSLLSKQRRYAQMKLYHGIASNVKTQLKGSSPTICKWWAKCIYLRYNVRQEVVQAIVQHHVWTYCSVNSSLKRRAWLATVGCEALLTTTLQHKHPVWRTARLTDMSNGSESLHHRNKWLAYGCWQAMPKGKQSG